VSGSNATTGSITARARPPAGVRAFADDYIESVPGSDVRPPRPRAAPGRGAGRRPPGGGSSGGRPSGGPGWARVLVVIGAVLMALSGLALAGGALALSRYTGAVTQEPLLGDAAADGRSVDGPITMLLVGIDERPNNPDDGVRADSIIIVHIPADHAGAYLVSIPRDSRVRIPAYPTTRFTGEIGKINSAFQYGFQNDGGRQGGFQLLALTVGQLAGLRFDAGAIVNFDGFRKVVDSIGGIDLCVDEETTSVHVGWDKKTGKEGVPYRLSPPNYDNPRLIPGMRPQVYHVGCQHFVGWQALDYVRQRELIPDGDYGRQRHQQQFLKAVATKTKHAGLANPRTLDSVLRAAGSAVTFDGNHVPLADWLFTLRSIDPANVVTIKTNGGEFHSANVGGQSFETLDETSLQLLRAVGDDDVGAFLARHPELISTDPGP
jgi:LCP family protein required for cell wall assembly